MFHYSPNINTEFYPSSYSPTAGSRHRYLTALAQAKAAEAEYLAVQAVQEEEDALRLRLQELQTRKQHIARGVQGYSEPYGSLSNYVSHDNISNRRTHTLRLPIHALEEEVLFNLNASRNPVLRQQEENARARKEQLLISSLLSQPETAQFRSHNLPSSPQGVPGYSGLLHQRSLHNVPEYTPEPALSGLAEKNIGPALDFVLNVLQQKFSPAQEIKPSNPPPHKLRNEDILSSLLGGVINTNTPPKQPANESNSFGPDLANISGLTNYNLFDSLSCNSGKEAPIMKPNASSAPKTVPPATSSSAKTTIVPSLKDQLESRLNNQYATEIRDTIQAILDSLALSAPQATPTSSQQHKTSDGGFKGKSRESSPSVENATSKDVMDSMNHVENIGAAFSALESDFIFPTTLDFTCKPASAELASTDTGNATSHLAFTSKNHPLRFYEQALGSLLSQLDSIESYGNETLRERRKEIVGRVEHALEELEREVETRWRLKVAKETRNVTSSPVSANPTSVEGDVPKEDTIHENLAVDTVSDGADVPKEAEPSQNISVESEAVVDPVSVKVYFSEDVTSIEEPPKYTVEGQTTDDGNINIPITSSSDASSSPASPSESSPSIDSDSVQQVTAESLTTVSHTPEPDSHDSFLLQETPLVNEKPKRLDPEDNEGGSDWSEIDA